MQNGTRKGGTLQTYQTLRSAPRLQDIWQLHWSYNGLLEHNPPALFIANVDDPQVVAAILTAQPPSSGAPGGAPGGGRGGHTGPAFLIKIAAHPDGSFVVTNTRNGFSKTYRRP